MQRQYINPTGFQNLSGLDADSNCIYFLEGSPEKVNSKKLVENRVGPAFAGTDGEMIF